ncbi:D-alanyl-D-alanine carboxypeptidase family protein [uncultured Treponema sp.]|uniref:D-alanyl-D-alanine carboxypeptidase family protein n=1 Tax=uncultured Treponema sp. TaxID=162155 RepID=UPI0025E3677C|nr:D-alanyl-D-alanine carboxypeptidase family protein [uncultured Treponema sp.]
MDIYDVTDDFIDEETKRAKKDSASSKKKPGIKYISDFDDFFEKAEREKKSPSEGKKIRKFENPFKIFMRMSRFGKTFVLSSLGVIVFAILICVFISYSSDFKNTGNVKALSLEQESELSVLLDSLYPEQRTSILKELPYSVNKANLDVWAGAAILIDASNGCVLFEKNADEIIPPASIAKLFVMYIVFKDVADGKITLDDVVTLPERSWAINMPKDASLMFLGQGQIVTLRELLKGLAVASGNDAALAVADYISGSTKAFVERMNQECAALGLTHTHFVEPSGYDENNLTTARELAAFCCEYIKRFPQSVEEFHSAPSIRYPLEKNLPSWQKSKGDSTAIYQRNTNPLLGVMEGCDGIKTGFIYESRYNLALTAKRNGVRFISITMKGTGIGSKQGNAGRVHDGTEMMEWAFSNFADFNPSGTLPEFYAIPAIGSKNTAGKFVKLIPAWSSTITVPHVSGESASADAQSVKATVNIPRFIYGGVEAGRQYGQIQYMLGDVVLETVPLVADRTYERAGIFGQALGALVSWRL